MSSDGSGLQRMPAARGTPRLPAEHIRAATAWQMSWNVFWTRGS